MVIKTSDPNSIKSILEKFNIPQKNSHKGQNGRVLIVGGSSLFHSASIWAAEVASHIVDIVHYSSTLENNEIFLALKKKFHNGIVVSQKDLENYVREDDAILLGPGMVRGDKDKGESGYTYSLTKRLIEGFPEKKFVFDAGALQMMNRDWLPKLKTPAIITPHQKEFEELFKISILEKTIEEKAKIVTEIAARYNVTILLKAIDDIATDGKDTYIIVGGNQGLTKGGTGDVLAGLAVSFFATNRSIDAALLSSWILKKVSDELKKTKGIWYNVEDITAAIPRLLHGMFFGRI